jgi:hypothetical protein
VLPLSCLVATTQRQLDDALRVRWNVFGEELRLLGGALPPVPREVDCFDTLPTTVHLVVYAGSKPVATSRLLLPNPEVSLLTGQRLGIALEQKLDLSGVAGPGLSLAESTRFCILKEWRHSEVLVRLQAGLYQESRRLGVSHWIASANTETDCAEDAELLFHVATAQRLVSPRWKVTTLCAHAAPELPEAPLYTPLQRLRACQGQLEGLRLPRTLALFSRKMGARFIGTPLYDAGFRRFSMPLIAALDDVPATTLALFDALASDAPRAA